MRKSRFCRLLLMALIVGASLTLSTTVVFAAGKAKKQKAGASGSFKAGVVVPTMNIFYVPLTEAVVAAVKEAGGTAIVTDAEQYKVAKELANVENLLQQKIDVLIIDASDKVASSPAVEAANKAGVPVIGLNNETASGKFVTVVASDNYKAGKLAAEFVLKEMDFKGNVAIMDGPPVPAVIDRIQAFKDMVYANPGVKIVSFQLMGNTIAEGVSVAENILQANPDLDGFLCMNDAAFLGAYTALQNAGRVGEVAIGAIDAIPEVVELLAKGLAPRCATAAQFPKEIGKGAVQAFLDHRAGKTLPNNIYVKVELITKDNAEGFHW